MNIVINQPDVKGTTLSDFPKPTDLVHGSLITTLDAPPPEPYIPGDIERPEAPLVDFPFTYPLEREDGTTFVFDPFHRIHLEPVRGRLLAFDGFSINKEWQGDYIVNLEIHAPWTPPYIITFLTGVITGLAYFWKYRFVNSTTGKVSGFSPLSGTADPTDYPDGNPPTPTPWDLTDEAATFRLFGSDDPQVDTIELFRNTTGQQDVFHLVASVPAPPNSQSYVEYTDGLVPNRDEDEFIVFRESDLLIDGKTFYEGIMYPHTKSLYHLGYNYNYGLVRMGLYAPEFDATVDVTQFASRINCNGWWPDDARMKQTFRLEGDETAYEIVQINEDDQWIEVFPIVQRTSAIGLKFSIEDTRNGMLIAMSESGRPGTAATYMQFTISEDVEDVLMNAFSHQGSLFFVSQKKIYYLEGDVSVEPWYDTTPHAMVEEGQVGPQAGTMVPGLGYVYVNRDKGVRVFTGSDSSYLGRIPEVNMIGPEFTRFNQMKLWETQVAYDPIDHAVVITYARDEEAGLSNQLTYYISEQEWVGPWKRKAHTFGMLKNPVHGRVPCFGSDNGTLNEDHRGIRDSISTGTLNGVITDFVPNLRYYSQDAEFGNLRDAPVFFMSPDGNQFAYGRIGTSGGNYFDLYDIPSVQPVIGWYYFIGAIQWTVTTGYLDLGDVGLRKEFMELRCRTVRKSTGTIRNWVAVDAEKYHEAHSGQGDVKADDNAKDKIFVPFKIDRRGVAFQWKLTGIGNADEPRVTAAEMVMEVARGRSPTV